MQRFSLSVTKGACVSSFGRRCYGISSVVAALSIMCGGSILTAQKPTKRAVVGVQGYLSTPALGKYDQSILARLHVPAGFRVSVFADRIGSPRMLLVSDDGTVYVTRRDSNDVIALRDDGNGHGVAPRKVVSNLHNVHGTAIHDGKATSSVLMLDVDRLVPVIPNLPDCADIEYDPKHERIAVPLTSQNRVEFYEVPRPPKIQ